MKEQRESAAERRDPTRLRRKKGHPVWRDLSDTLKKKVSGKSRERSEEFSILYRNSDIEDFFFQDYKEVSWWEKFKISLSKILSI